MRPGRVFGEPLHKELNGACPSSKRKTRRGMMGDGLIKRERERVYFGGLLGPNDFSLVLLGYLARESY